jgi:hypothetical protein
MSDAITVLGAYGACSGLMESRNLAVKAGAAENSADRYNNLAHAWQALEVPYRILGVSSQSLK